MFTVCSLPIGHDSTISIYFKYIHYEQFSFFLDVMFGMRGRDCIRIPCIDLQHKIRMSAMTASVNFLSSESLAALPNYYSLIDV